ncbi:hypothetical protein JXB41_06055 [Candidatus Woesearchaeota archaeon]|nr:hypothetical protein [Candidatus Woesearchaeota archaeon]
MAEKNKSKTLEDLPEPPKFDLKDLPEPPKIEQEKNKKGFFGKIFSKKETPDNPDDLPAPKKKKEKQISESELVEEEHEPKFEIPPPPELEEPPRIVPLEQEPQSKKPELGDIPPAPEIISNMAPISSKKISGELNLKKQAKKKPEPKPESLPDLPELTPLNFPEEKELPLAPDAEKKQKKPGFFSNLFKKKAKKRPGKNIVLPPPPDLPKKPDLSIEKESVETKPKIEDMPPFEDISSLPDEIKPLETKEGWEEEKGDIEETEKELHEEGLIKSDFKLKELPLKEKPAEPTPLTKVKGVGRKTAEELKKKLKVKSAEELAEHTHTHIAKKTKLTKKQAKKIITHAKKIAKKKKAIKPGKLKSGKSKNILDLISEIEKEKEQIDKLKKEDVKNLPDMRGYGDILQLMEKLEKKKLELLDYEKQLRSKEIKLDTADKTYKRDANYLDNLKRRLDHDIRERTNYLIELEKDFFEKGQNIAKKQSKTELKAQELDEREALVKEKEAIVRKKLHELEDREITYSAREKKLNKLMKQLDRQEELLKQKETDLEKSEQSYLKRMDTLKEHEKETNRLLDKREKEIDTKAQELRKLTRKVEKREKVIDIEDRALDYAETEVEKERSKLEDDEFRQYLHEKLGLMKETGIGIGDIEKTQNIRVPDLTDRQETIQDLIKKCRDLINLKRTHEAKIFYNQIRGKYYQLRFASDSEKETLHNTIRQLYDEINLSEL